MLSLDWSANLPQPRVPQPEPLPLIRQTSASARCAAGVVPARTARHAPEITADRDRQGRTDRQTDRQHLQDLHDAGTTGHLRLAPLGFAPVMGDYSI